MRRRKHQWLDGFQDMSSVVQSAWIAAKPAVSCPLLWDAESLRVLVALAQWPVQPQTPTHIHDIAVELQCIKVRVV